MAHAAKAVSYTFTKFFCSSGSPPDSCSEAILKKMLCPHFPVPLMKMNLGNTWIHNTRTAMALALLGLTTAATTNACRQCCWESLPHLPASQVSR
uniref:Uncharacterized protein n=1 Tax=Mus musculus TaxID=10090 RepID=Q3UEI2_MOUSE|nr:unnamed protein product [Mus musculus]